MKVVLCMQGGQAVECNFGPSREIQTPLIAQKVNIQQADAPASLDDNPGTGLSLVTPMEQHSIGQRLDNFCC